MISIIISCLIALLALTLIGGLVRHAVSSWWRDPRELLWRQKLSRISKLAAIAPTPQGIIDCIVFDIPLDTTANAALFAHHLSLLARFADEGAKRGLYIESLSVLEELFSNRKDLITALLESEAKFTNIRKTKAARGEVSWAIDELQSKVVEYKERLTTNERSIRSQFSMLLAELSEQVIPELLH